MLLVDFAEPKELPDDLIRFRRWIYSVAAARMGLNGFEQILRAAVVEEKDSLSKPPQGRRAELVSAGIAWLTSSARPGPMLWSITSEKRWTSLSCNAATDALPVCNVGVWHIAQPTSANNFSGQWCPCRAQVSEAPVNA